MTNKGTYQFQPNNYLQGFGICVVALKNSFEENCWEYLNEMLPRGHWSVVGSIGCLPMLFLLAMSIVQIVTIVSGNENPIMVSKMLKTSNMCTDYNKANRFLKLFILLLS